ncbi:MAG: DUF2892 domain-containing protein [Pseudomonadota bacterium]
MINMGKLDRGARLAVAVLLALYVIGFGGTSVAAVNWAALLVALVALVTAIAGNCPLYRILGIRTCQSG